jgi:hypothetical protein
MQHATNGVGMVVMTVATMIDGVLPTAMRMALEQPQFPKQSGVIGDPHHPARE